MSSALRASPEMARYVRVPVDRRSELPRQTPPSCCSSSAPPSCPPGFNCEPAMVPQPAMPWKRAWGGQLVTRAFGELSARVGRRARSGDPASTGTRSGLARQRPRTPVAPPRSNVRVLVHPFLQEIGALRPSPYASISLEIQPFRVYIPARFGRWPPPSGERVSERAVPTFTTPRSTG